MCFLHTLSFFAGITLSLPLGLGVEPNNITEQDVKAAYLFNFAKFVEWPDSSFVDNKAPIVFAVLGDSKLALVLEKTVEGKAINGRALAIKELKSVKDLEPCHILFVGESQKADLPAILGVVACKNTLTVSDIDGFTRQGGACRFFIEERKVRFELNLDATRRAELKVSSKLLKVGKVLRDELPQGSR